MVGWQMRQKPGSAREQAEPETLAFMGRMPAWKDHPRVVAALRGPQGRVGTPPSRGVPSC